MSNENEAAVVRSQLRMPEELHTQIVTAAKASHRTMNAEIVYRLTKSYDQMELSRKLDFIISMLRAKDPDAFKRYYSECMADGITQIEQERRASNRAKSS